MAGPILAAAWSCQAKLRFRSIRCATASIDSPAMEGAPSGGPGTEDSAAYQAALGDILETLGRAPFDLDAVLRTILTHTTRLCHATRGFIYLLGEDGLYRHAADIG